MGGHLRVDFCQFQKHFKFLDFTSNKNKCHCWVETFFSFSAYFNELCFTASFIFILKLVVKYKSLKYAKKNQS